MNHAERIVIFGAWDIYDEGNRSLILKEGWAKSRRGKKQPAYSQSREHIRLVEEEGYKLRTFTIQYQAANPADDEAPAKIKGYTPELIEKSLIRVGDSWYASDGVLASRLPEELDPIETLTEGVGVTVTINQFERSAEARRQCIAHHGYACVVCGFDFERVYGALGRGYIHVHHVTPLAEVRREYIVDPKTDLVPICPNCHAMVHSTRPALDIANLKRQMEHK